MSAFYDLSGCFSGHGETDSHTPANGGSGGFKSICRNPHANDELRANSIAKQFAAYQVPQPTARLNLAVALPPTYGFNGGCTTIRDLDRLGLYRGHLGITPNMEAAVRLVMRAAMEAVEAWGNGNRWQRRLHRMRMADAVAVINGHAHPTDLNREAAMREEVHTEGRIFRHHSPAYLHP